jgi:hypothetical protein
MGASTGLELWVAIGVAIGRPLAVTLSREIEIEPAGTGHLAIQELVMRLAQRSGAASTFELPTRPATPARSIDVGIRDDLRRMLFVIEIWNRLDDLGAAIRGFDRKMAEAGALAVAIAHGREQYRVASCWILRDTVANRRLVARYPAILGSRFPGSSLGWVRALTNGHPIPADPGLIWASADARRLVPLRWHPLPQRAVPRDSS